jgi:hypothetical protein
MTLSLTADVTTQVVCVDELHAAAGSCKDVTTLEKLKEVCVCWGSWS